jgi:hypothetical protein
MWTLIHGLRSVCRLVVAPFPASSVGGLIHLLIGRSVDRLFGYYVHLNDSAAH